MRIRLLNDGGYKGLSHLAFPIEMNAADCIDEKFPHCVYVKPADLVKIGYSRDTSGMSVDFSFLIGTECEIIK